MPIDPLAQRTIFEDHSRIALRMPLGPVLGAFHPDGCFPLVEDPRASGRACIVGMMVLRPPVKPWFPADLLADVPAAVGNVRDWCFDVEGVGGSWPISGGNAVDAYRLALQYGTVDAVMAGANTMTREGVAHGPNRGHLWQPYAPLSWPVLRSRRHELEGAIAEVRRHWQDQGLLSGRRYPAQIAVTRGLAREPGSFDILDARVFHEKHPDGSPVEAWLLTSEAGEGALRERAQRKQRGLEDRILVCSPVGHPEEIDAERVPELLRRRLDARLVEHDGGAISLAAFVEAGAVAQLNLTLMRGRPVREVLQTSNRIDGEAIERLLSTWPRAARLFPKEGGRLPESWKPFHAVVEVGSEAEAVVVSFDVRGR